MLGDPRHQHCAKIREIISTLAAAGHVSLDAQAAALGLSRSTTWAIQRAGHKKSGLSATIINRIRAQPGLPAPVRAVLDEYVEAKSAGIYGHNETQRRRFAARLLVTSPPLQTALTETESPNVYDHDSQQRQ